MSSLAAARADNFYFPPEWRPEYGGISKFAGSKGANQYEQYGIIRFELPFDGWCLGCSRHMSKGLRFNAKKEKEGKYFSTQIFSFHMKCYSCDQKIVIETDPENRTYKFVEGIRKHEQDYIPDDDDAVLLLTDDNVRSQLASDPMYRLQHEKAGSQAKLTNEQRLAHLEVYKESVSRQDYDMNAALRSRHRAKKKHDQLLVENGRKRGLAIPLLDFHETDDIIASKAIFKTGNADTCVKSEKSRVSSIVAQSIFDQPRPMKKRKRSNIVLVPPDPGLDIKTTDAVADIHSAHSTSKEKISVRKQSLVVVVGDDKASLRARHVVKKIEGDAQTKPNPSSSGSSSAALPHNTQAPSALSMLLTYEE
jgi:coiled-coil domain-containing protein 130